MNTKTKPAVYVVICDGNFDAIWETKCQANKEAKDLRSMGYEIRIKEFPNWQAAEAYEEKLRGY